MQRVDSTIESGVSASRELARTARHRLRPLVPVARATAFWLAVLLPVVYLPLLFTSWTWSVPAISLLLGIHVVTVLVGYEHDPSD